MSWVEAGRTDDLEPGRVKVIEVCDERIALCNVDGEFYAIADECSHDGGPLDQGELFGDRIECPRHGAQFDVKSGKALKLPAVRPIASYATRVNDDGTVEVEFE